VTGLFALSEKETVDHHCDATKGCDQSGYDAARTGHTLATASDIAFVGAAVLTAAGLWLVLWEPGGAAHGASRSSTTSLRIAPGPGATEIGLKGSF
jgi:hypothetical protein